MTADERAVWAAAYATEVAKCAFGRVPRADLEAVFFCCADTTLALWHLYEFQKTYLGPAGTWVRVLDIKELAVGDKIAYDWTSDHYHTGFGMRLLQLGTVVTARPGCVEAEHDHTNLYCKSGTTLVDELFATRIVFKKA